MFNIHTDMPPGEQMNTQNSEKLKTYLQITLLLHAHIYAKRCFPSVVITHKYFCLTWKIRFLVADEQAIHSYCGNCMEAYIFKMKMFREIKIALTSINI